MKEKTVTEKIIDEMTPEIIPEWVSKHQKTLADRRAATMKEKGLAPFYTLEEGETKIHIDLSKPPREEKGDFGEKTIFRININDSNKGTDGKEYDLSCSDSLATKIYNALMNGVNPMTIIRVGEQKQTRYSIKELKKQKNKV